ncbi:delta(3,5)-Delta(2,4)-dienoyl-CoA isomerase, mitochondrial [Ornithorhynchus anatinus]|nr:delta(3,5)-Delta(2,4)-dienoyl-CoA isomerase, mitochondrial [Ornithorhynchus anatinus]
MAAGARAGLKMAAGCPELRWRRGRARRAVRRRCGGPFRPPASMAALAAASCGLRGALRRHLASGARPRIVVRPLSSAQAEPRAMDHGYESLKVTPVEGHVLHVELNRPVKRNAMSKAFWREMVECFNKISQDSECRAVVLSGAGKMFTSGIDLTDMAGEILQQQQDDTARVSWILRDIITRYQETFNVLEKCPKPVIAAIHGGCIGGGVDLISACDIRYCSQDAWFQVKEVDVGLAADVGTLQRLPRIVGSQSLVNELAFTARKMMADEALSSGLVSRVFQTKEALMAGALALATEIASKSPVAVQGTKVNLVYSRDHSVAEGLNFMASWNMSMLQTDDIMKSVQALMEKKELKTVKFSKL